MAMSDAAEPTQNPSASTSKNKKNKKKKKAAAAKVEGNGSAPAVNGVEHIEPDEGDDAEEEPESPVKESIPTAQHLEAPTSQKAGANGTPLENTQEIQTSTETSTSNTTAMSGDTSELLDALARERDTLRVEVTELRKSLETIQSKHEEDSAGLKEQLEETQNGKEQAETQYRNLLGKVNTIRSQLGERLKQDAEDLAQARTQIEQLEEQNRSVNEENESLHEDVLQLRKANEKTASEVAELRNRSNVSQSNWIQERDELVQREAMVKEECDNARQAMQDWEVLAMEERSLRENLGERVSELEEQLGSTKEAYESAAADRDAQVSKLDTLQRRVQEEHDARKRELREIVEQSQSQLETLRKQLQAAEETSATSKEALESTQKELERAIPFEKEVKEKNLLIGKLRHEAVILNDHLKKALRLLRKGKPEDNVDRNIVTNHFLHFLALDRSDPKKFQILQLIAALLNWSDEQREQAGLSRPGASNTSLRIPLSPFRRTPSTPSLNADTLLMNDSSNKESLAELWSNFLEHEALEGTPALSRRESVASPSNDEPSNKGKDRVPSSSSGLGIS